MVFVDKFLSDDSSSLNDFFITHSDVMSFTGLNSCSVSNNLSVCVKNGWLRREYINNGAGREVRYYFNGKDIIGFVQKYLR